MFRILAFLLNTRSTLLACRPRLTRPCNEGEQNEKIDCVMKALNDTSKPVWTYTF